MDPCGRGVRRDGGNTSELDRFGVTGPLGVEPIAGEPPLGALRDVAPPVVPAAEPVEPEPELLPPEPDD
jgi:hypothetical protein